MPEERLRICLDPETAVAPVGVKERMALMEGQCWGADFKLRVRFLEGNEDARQRVRKHALEWRKHANINIMFVEEGDSEVRIAFKPGASWSRLGREALQYDQNTATMNLDLLHVANPDDEYPRIVLHEFGHALGCIHEHQHPAGGIAWKKQKVYDYYLTNFGWSTARVDKNIFNTYDKDLIKGTGEVDPDSIMMYPIPKELTDDGMEVGWNRKLSTTDKTFIKTLYPF